MSADDIATLFHLSLAFAGWSAACWLWGATAMLNRRLAR